MCPFTRQRHQNDNRFLAGNPQSQESIEQCIPDTESKPLPAKEEHYNQQSCLETDGEVKTFQDCTI